MANLISAAFPQQDVTVVNESIETLKTKMPFLKSLSAKEKQSLFKPGENYIPFIERCVNVVEAHPEIMSGTFSVEEFKKDVELFVTLKPIYQKLALLYQAMEDTITAAGCDALEESLEVYDEVKSHLDKIPGLKAASDELKSYFPRNRKKQNTDTPNS